MARLSAIGRVDPYSSAKTLGMPPWKIKKIQQQLRGWDAARLAQAMQIATELNGAVKGQSADAEYALEKAVREISQMAGRRGKACYLAHSLSSIAGVTGETMIAATICVSL